MRRVLGMVAALAVLLGGGAPLRADEVAELRQRLAEARLEARRVEAEEKALAEREAAAEASLREHVRALYRMSRAGMLPLAGGLEALLSHAGRVSRLRRVVAQDERLLQQLRERRRMLRAERARQAERLAELRERLAEAEQASAHRQQEALLAALRSSRFAPSFAAGGAAGVGFAAQRGELASPLAGTFRVASAGDPAQPALRLLGRGGAPVRAAADGRVAFADRLDPDGLVVVLDHGGGWFTVYAGLGEVAVQLDDYVGRGATLGRLGSTGALRFEVRQGRRAVDPGPWLGF